MSMQGLAESRPYSYHELALEEEQRMNTTIGLRKALDTYLGEVTSRAAWAAVNTEAMRMAENFMRGDGDG